MLQSEQLQPHVYIHGETQASYLDLINRAIPFQVLYGEAINNPHPAGRIERRLKKQLNSCAQLAVASGLIQDTANGRTLLAMEMGLVKASHPETVTYEDVRENQRLQDTILPSERLCKLEDLMLLSGIFPHEKNPVVDTDNKLAYQTQAA